MQWKITNRCNLQCKHCYEGEKCVEQLSDAQIQSIFQKLLDSNILNLTITGGEALLVDNLAKYVSQCLEKGIMVNIFTNGIMLDNFIEQLGDVKNGNLLTFEVSVDGAQEEHDYIRGKGIIKKLLPILNVRFKKDIKLLLTR